MSTLQALYDSEINYELSTFWDAGVKWRLGDHMNGWKETGEARTLDGAVAEIADAARRHYPNSTFAALAGEEGKPGSGKILDAYDDIFGSLGDDGLRAGVERLAGEEGKP